MEAALANVTELTGKQGPVAVATALASADYIMLYFSASWCPPCKMFTPRLAEFYNKNKDSKKFEIIFISSDRDMGSFAAYYDHHPWLAYYGPQCPAIGAKYGVRGIPALVVLDKAGNVITADGRTGVMNDPTADRFPWA